MNRSQNAEPGPSPLSRLSHALARAQVWKNPEKSRPSSPNAEDHPPQEDYSDPLPRKLLSNLQDCILIINRAQKITYVAGNSLGLLGYAPDDLALQGADLLQLVDPRDRPFVQQELEKICGDPKRTLFEARVTDSAGEERWLEFAFTPLHSENETEGLQVTLRDISDRVRAEEMMRSLNEAGQAVQKASLSLEDVLQAITDQLKALEFHSAIGLFDGSAEQIRWAQIGIDDRRYQALKQLKIDPSPLKQGRILYLIEKYGQGQPASFILDEAILSEVLGAPETAWQVAQVMGHLWVAVAPLRADGRDLGLLVVASPSPRPDTLPAIQAFANQTAIAIRNAQLVSSLAEREMQYRAIFEAARDGLLVLDENGRITSVSSITCDLFGYEANEIVGAPLSQLISLEPTSLAQWSERVLNGTASVTIQCTALRRNGETFPIELRGSCLCYREGNRILALITDISERVRAQEALIQAERLGALGQMAGGIAHDFNNILVNILGYAQVAKEDLEMPERLAEHLTHIEAAAREAADVVSRLQSLYREKDDRSDFIPTQLDDILLDAIALNRPRWKDIPQLQGITIHIETHLTRPPLILGNPVELKRVLSNLIINAIDAMPHGGTIYCETRERGPYSQVLIRDSGIGIAPKDLPRIFEPFYTTKKSSGLGLTISKNIIERHGGIIEVESVENQGTTFVIRLPIASQEALTRFSTPLSEAVTLPTVPLTILVVDDEPGVRGVLRRMLEREGHNVVVADSGQRGIQLLEEQRFDLLICDLGMPDVPGSRVMQRAHALYPDMPIILTTGWGDSITPEQLRTLHATSLLPKPFERQDLFRTLAAVCQKHRSASTGSTPPRY